MAVSGNQRPRRACRAGLAYGKIIDHSIISARGLGRFQVWIETSAENAKTIDSVDYFFEHPSFLTKRLQSKQGPTSAARFEFSDRRVNQYRA